MNLRVSRGDVGGRSVSWERRREVMWLEHTCRELFLKEFKRSSGRKRSKIDVILLTKEKDRHSGKFTSQNWQRLRAPEVVKITGQTSFPDRTVKEKHTWISYSLKLLTLFFLWPSFSLIPPPSGTSLPIIFPSLWGTGVLGKVPGQHLSRHKPCLDTIGFIQPRWSKSFPVRVKRVPPEDGRGGCLR